MSLLIDSLNSILAWLEQNNPEVAASLQPGLSRDEIESKLVDLPFKLPEELYELYQWRNGSPESSNYNCLDFFECYRLMPLSESLETIKDLEADHGILAEIFPYAWFPIFNFEGEYLSVIGSEQKISFSPVVSTYEGGESLEYKNLTSMMETIAECYQTKAYYLDENNYVKAEQDKVTEINQKYNPGISLEPKYTINSGNNTNQSSDCRNYYTVERSYCDHDKYEYQEIVTATNLWQLEVTEIKRRYINGILKKESINIRIKNKLLTLILPSFTGIFVLLYIIVTLLVSLLLRLFFLPVSLVRKFKTKLSKS